MRHLEGRVAVITGGAGTFGRALAAQFGTAGMAVVLADLHADALGGAVAALRAKGVRAIGVPTDVSQPASVEALAAATIAEFGAVHLVVNNAGVAPLGAAWENTPADWTWAIGVNVLGVVNGVRAFVPRLIEHGGEGHVVNVASVAGLISPPGMALYNATKHAVVAFTESLAHDLARIHAKVGVSLVCPAYFPSGIGESERSRPHELKNANEPSAHQRALAEVLKKAVHSGKITADQIAMLVLAAVREDRFYVLSHPRILGAVQARLEDVIAQARPRDPLELK